MKVLINGLLHDSINNPILIVFDNNERKILNETERFVSGPPSMSSEEKEEFINTDVEKLNVQNLIIYVNEEFEEERALFNLSNNKVILQGDWYHDKIDAKIEGFLLALGIEDDVPTEWIDKDHEHFNLLRFYS